MFEPEQWKSGSDGLSTPILEWTRRNGGVLRPLPAVPAAVAFGAVTGNPGAAALLAVIVGTFLYVLPRLRGFRGLATTITASVVVFVVFLSATTNVLETGFRFDAVKSTYGCGSPLTVIEQRSHWRDGPPLPPGTCSHAVFDYLATDAQREASSCRPGKRPGTTERLS
jgi:hypothetical protein